MRPVPKAILTFLATFWLAVGSYAALEARLDVQPQLLRLGESARCTLTVSGVNNPSQVDFSDLDGIQIRSLGQSTSVNMVNLKFSKSTQFSYSLTPRHTGNFKIGPYNYQAGGEQTNIPAVELKVISPSGNANETDRSQQTLSDMLFARIEIPQNKIYNQQSFNIVLKIFAREGVNLTGNFEPYGFPDDRIKLGQFASLGSKRIEMDGKLYTLYQFSAPARATSSDEYNIQPGLRAAVRSSRRGQRSNSPFGGDAFFDSFFDRAQVEQVEVPVQPLAVNVLALPSEGRPKSFSGAVGDLSFSVQAEPKELEAGNPITITMAVEGSGNIDNVTTPKVQLGDKFKSYEPNLISDDSNNGYSGARKVFEQVVIPRSADVKQLPIIEFSYFDPEKGEYQTVQRGPFPLKVSPSTSKVVQVSADNGEKRQDSKPEILGADIVYLKDTPDRDYSLDFFAPLSSLSFWSINAAPLVLLGMLYGWQRRRAFLLGNVAAARRQKAPKAARTALGVARAAIRADQRQRFFESIWNAATDYFGHRLNLAPGEVGSIQMLDFARKAGLDLDLIKRLESILSRCELERFGAATAGEGDWHKDAGDIEAGMRELLKRCERVRIKSGAANIRIVSALAVLLTLGATFVCLADSDQKATPARVFGRAAEAYDSGKLDLALQEYKEVLKQGNASPQLFYNIGNTYFRKRAFGEAVLFYRKAWYLTPRDPDIGANLELALSETKALSTRLNPLMRLTTSLSAGEWLRLAVGAYWVLMALLIVAVVLASHRSLLLRSAIPVALLLALALAGTLSWGRIMAGDESVVVGESRAALFAPIEGSTAHFTLPIGSIVSVVDRANGWIQVKVNDMSGWIPESSVKRVLTFE